jgi:hypothetical protein
MPHHGEMRSRLVPSAVVLTLALVACGSDDTSSDDSASMTTEAVETTVGAEPVSTGGGGTTSATNDQNGSPPASGGGDAVLTLFDGQEFEFDVVCTLEPQMAAGSEILFTAVSYDDPGLDITQFGDEGTITGVAAVTVYDANLETLWEASTSYEPFGGSLELTLEGSTISGQGDFYPDADPTMDPIPGRVQANC